MGMYGNTFLNSNDLTPIDRFIIGESANYSNIVKLTESSNESFGDKLKTIINAVIEFFKKVFDKITGFFKSIRDKISKHKSSKYKREGDPITTKKYTEIIDKIYSIGIDNIFFKFDIDINDLKSSVKNTNDQTEVNDKMHQSLETYLHEYIKNLSHISSKFSQANSLTDIIKVFKEEVLSDDSIDDITLKDYEDKKRYVDDVLKDNTEEQLVHSHKVVNAICLSYKDYANSDLLSATVYQIALRIIEYNKAVYTQIMYLYKNWFTAANDVLMSYD